MSPVRRILDPRFWIGVVGAAAAVVFVLQTESGTPGPGELSAVHASVPELEGGHNCVACHGDRGGGNTQDMASACNTCHEAIADQLADGFGFHGQLEGGDDCSRCHVEHLGAAYLPVDAATFVAAGFESRETYDHRGLAFELEGAHDGLACAECHPNADVDVLGHGDLRFMGASQDCTSCHEDVHRGTMGASCADCHGQERPFEEVSEFVHTSDFELVGPHGGLACSTCHEPGSAHAIEAYTDGALPRSCADCHASPHGAAFVEAAGSSCVACHAPRR